MKIEMLDRYSDNAKKFLRTLLQSGGMTRNDLSQAVGVSVITLNKYLSEFIDDGIVIEDGNVESSGGRRPALLRINPDFRYILGVDIGAQTVKVGVVSICGDIVEKELYSDELGTLGSFHFPVEKLMEKMDALITRHDRKKFVAISIGISGLVDSKNNKVVFCPNVKEWNGINVCAIMKEHFEMPVFVDTSARCIARAEKRFGLARGVDNSLYVALGGGIAVGIVANNVIYEGEGFAGELGHIQVVEGDSALCTCGNSGCLEMYATLPMILLAIFKRAAKFEGYSPAKELFEQERSLAMVIKAMETGDKVVYGVLDDVASMVGNALSITANLLNPNMIILGGSVIEVFPKLVGKICDVIRQRSLLTSYRNLEVKASEFSWEGGVLGSAVRVIDMIFD